jgi:hypothetical protein
MTDETPVDVQLLMQHLRQFQLQARAIDHQIEVILAWATQPSSTITPETCLHPVALRQSRMTMGHPNRFFCRQCRTIVEE